MTGKLIADARASMETMYLEEEAAQNRSRAFGAYGGRKKKAQPGQSPAGPLDGVKGQFIERSPRDRLPPPGRQDPSHEHQISG